MRELSALFLIVSCVLAAHAGPAPVRPQGKGFSAWPEADLLFRSDPRWTGGDAAYSVDLGRGRTLWLFGDSFIDPAGSGKRAGADMPRNTIAIQKGPDPSTAKMSFYWKTAGGKPSAFFPAQGEAWLWPAHGIRMGKSLLLFFMKILPDATDGMGFKVAGSAAAMVDNPDAEPSQWRVRQIETPRDFPDLPIGSAVLKDDGHLYAFCPRGSGHQVILARWPIDQAAAGLLSAPQWWAGDGVWTSASDLAGQGRSPAALFNGATEFSVHRDKASGRFIEVQTQGFGAADVVLRRADRPEGPWSAPEKIYRPTESDRPGILVYAGKAHAHLRGGLSATYATNVMDPKILEQDLGLYFPRFMRLAPE